MTTHLKAIGIMVLSLLVIFAVLDFFNLTSYLLYPYSTVTGKNNGLTSSLGNAASINGG